MMTLLWAIFLLNLWMLLRIEDIDRGIKRKKLSESLDTDEG